jgi:hypothetical protein
MVDADVEESLVAADLAMVVTAVKGRREMDGLERRTKRPGQDLFSSLSA